MDINNVNTILNVIHKNQLFQKNTNINFFRTFKNTQTPTIALLTCCDSRIHEHAFCDIENYAFCIRNIGNQYERAKSDINYAIKHLNIQIIFIIGHVDCGAIKAISSCRFDETKNFVCNESDQIILDGLQNIYIEENYDIKKDANNSRIEHIINNNSIFNVHSQVSECCKMHNDLIKDNKLIVIGAMYDFSNYYNMGYGNLMLINVNGKKINMK
jgi:carbonic anhydrase